MDIKELKKHWNRFGKADPLWAIVTQPDKKGNRWQRDDFFSKANGKWPQSWITSVLWALIFAVQGPWTLVAELGD
jgi:hypothetical protein